MATVQSMISSTAIQYGVDPSLALAVAQAESNFNQNAISPKGAIGVFQLLPSTAAGLGVDPNNLQQNIQGGIQYLAQLLQQFGGDESLALAAYNAGPGNVAKYGGVPPFSETQNYIDRVLGLADSFGAPQVNTTPVDVSGTLNNGIIASIISDTPGSSLDLTPILIGAATILGVYFFFGK